MVFMQFHGIFLKSSRSNRFYLGVPITVNYLLKLTMGYEGKLNKGFSSFFAIFDDFSKWIVPKALQNFEKSSIMAKFGKK